MNMERWLQEMKEWSFPEFNLLLERAEVPELFRVNIKTLAGPLEASPAILLTLFLRAVEKGFFILNWEYHCPHCKGIPDFKHNFSDLASESFCGLCNLAFRNTLDTNVEVTFTAHPSLMPIPETFKASYREKVLAAITSGSYSPPEEFLSGFECLNNPVYQELFGSEVLSAEESLEISKVTLLFTDIKGSTQMYSRLGDAASYHIVREHFKILYQEIEAQGGVVVKTMGDAVMASFLHPSQGVKAALSAYEIFKTREWAQVGKLEIKMGLHAGSVIAVNLNSHVDYFGNTVNKSARIQGMAEDHTVCFTKDILEEPGVKALLRAWSGKFKGKVYRHTVELKGIDGPVDFYRIQDPT